MDLKRPISDETHCKYCIHDEVCRKDMGVWCQNYSPTNIRGRLVPRDCSMCVHADERHPPEGKTPLKCWSCAKFKSAFSGK